MKRLVDIVFSLAALALLLPFLVILTALAKFVSGRVFVLEKGVGKDLRVFKVRRFRFLAAPRKRPGGLSAGLRSLPLLWNVLKGEMSLVGPGLEVTSRLDRKAEGAPEILSVRPGLIDISVSAAGECDLPQHTKDPEMFYEAVMPERIRLAKEYAKKASVRYDLRLLAVMLIRRFYPEMTVVRVLEFLAPYRKTVVIGIQLAVFLAAYYLSFYIRFDSGMRSAQFHLFVKYLPFLLFFRMIFLFAFSLDKGLWMYTSVSALINIGSSVTLGSLLFFISIKYFFGDTAYPRSIFIIDWLLTIFLLGGISLSRRLHEKAKGPRRSKRRVIVIGAGGASEMLLRDIETSPFYPYEVVGLVDDDRMKKGLRIRNIPILGARAELDGILKNEDPDEFLICIPSVSSGRLQEIIEDLRRFGRPIKVLPGLLDILNGRDILGMIKPVEPEDVLFRAPICGDCLDLGDFFRDKRVMITGAGGSIGSELSTQIAALNPQALVLFERHEEGLYNIDMKLRCGPKDTAFLAPVIGDITDVERVREVMEKFRPDIVFHAAAYKHVPLMESNPYEAYRTNVIGTKIVAETARDLNVGMFVLISTDKAVGPANIMGKTKKIAENIVRCLLNGNPGETRYITVRFGNVLDSSGSVVPLFTEQIKKGGPVTVTHPDITRYFMTIPEAVRLVLQASAIGTGGEVFVLDMGEPVKILDLANRMINLYGYRPGIDIDIRFTGLRPGEKLYEELFNADEKIFQTAHPRINKAMPETTIGTEMLVVLESLKNPEFFKDDSVIEEILASIGPRQAPIEGPRKPDMEVLSFRK